MHKTSHVLLLFKRSWGASRCTCSFYYEKCMQQQGQPVIWGKEVVARAPVCLQGGQWAAYAWRGTELGSNIKEPDCSQGEMVHIARGMATSVCNLLVTTHNG